MVLNDNTGGQGIVQDVYFQVNADSNSYPIADLVRDANTSLDIATHLIISSDGRWQFDSTNQTDLLRGRADLVADQQDYSFDDDYLFIKSVEVLDSNGNITRLTPIDNNDLEDTEALTSYQNTSGLPLVYDKMGRSILLYPKPNYNKTAGLIVYFQRKIDYFTASDTDKEPGYAAHLHQFTSLFCQYQYAKKNSLPKLGQLEKDLLFYTGDQDKGGRNAGAIKTFYSRREKDFKTRLKVRQESTR